MKKKQQNKFSYKVIVRRKNKAGKYYYIEKLDGKEKITSRHEWENLQHTKQELKKVYKKGAKDKLKEYQKETKAIDKKQKAADKKKEKEAPPRKFNKEEVWGNSGATALEEFFLMNPKDFFISFSEVEVEETEVRNKNNLQYQRKADAYSKKHGKKIDKNTFSVYHKFIKTNSTRITHKNLMDARFFVSEVADIFYNRWQELKGTKDEPNSPQLKFYFAFFEDGETNIRIDKTMFSFEQIIFFKKVHKLYFDYFGK